MAISSAQSLEVKRAQVEFHSFASLGEPERASRAYREENIRRGAVLDSLRAFIGPLTPFLEIGANVGHSSLMLMEQFQAEGYALDLSADSLRHGYALMRQWGATRGPIRLAGDALHLPFADNSLRAVLAFQMLSQFMDIEAVFVEAKRVLMPGGLFLFAEEPLRRLATLRLWRTPYYEQMKPWERRLYDCGLLPFLVSDVIGAGQEENFGIRQNHRLTLADWRRLIDKHFAAKELRVFVPERGWLERWLKRLAIRLDPYRSVGRAGRILGGTLTAACRKAGNAPATALWDPNWHSRLVCPDCRHPLDRQADQRLSCTQCAFQAPLEGGVYNLLPTRLRTELYLGDRPDCLDMSTEGHDCKLVSGWFSCEGVPGNRYRWIGPEAVLRLTVDHPGGHRLRIRGFRPETKQTAQVEVEVNGRPAGRWRLKRPGLFVLESEVNVPREVEIRIRAKPVLRTTEDDRDLTVNLSMVRLLPQPAGSARGSSGPGESGTPGVKNVIGSERAGPVC